MRSSRLIGKIPKARVKSLTQVQDKNIVHLRDGSLIIDCRGCPGAKDLVDPGCMRCALRALSRLPNFDRLVLSGSLDVAYEGGCVQVLREMAEAVRLCRDAPLTNERSCSSCPNRPSMVLERLADSIPYYWDGQAQRSQPAQARAKCATCSDKVNAVMSAVLAKMRHIERFSSREAFMVVGESGNA